MKCPLCNTEMRIMATSYVTNEGRIFVKQDFTCRKRDCPNYDKLVKSVYAPLGDIQEDENAEDNEEVESE